MDADRFYGRWYGNKVRRRWWSFLNWLKGYKFGPVQRHRCCDHTTPGHGWSCDNHPGRTDDSGRTGDTDGR